MSAHSIPRRSDFPPFKVPFASLDTNTRDHSFPWAKKEPPGGRGGRKGARGAPSLPRMRP